MLTYVVHRNYGQMVKGGVKIALHLVKCGDTFSKILDTEALNRFLRGKKWRYAN